MGIFSWTYSSLSSWARRRLIRLLELDIAFDWFDWTSKSILIISCGQFRYTTTTILLFGVRTLARQIDAVQELSEDGPMVRQIDQVVRIIHHLLKLAWLFTTGAVVKDAIGPGGVPLKAKCQIVERLSPKCGCESDRAFSEEGRHVAECSFNPKLIAFDQHVITAFLDSLHHRLLEAIDAIV